MSTWCQNTICHYVIMQLFCLCIKWKVVQTWQPDNLTTWQLDNLTTPWLFPRVCLSFRHFCTLNANPYTQYHDNYHDYSDNYLDVYSDNYLDDYSDNYLDDYCYDYREACTLNLIYQFHLWKQSFPCLLYTLRHLCLNSTKIIVEHILCMRSGPCVVAPASGDTIWGKF